MKLKNISALFLAFIVVSCGKDDDPMAYPEENPLESYYAAANYTRSEFYFTNSKFESGLCFSPNVKGAIKAITVKLPATDNTLQVTLWDVDTKAILFTETVNINTADATITKKITAFPLVKDKKYLISMNSKSFYFRNSAVMVQPGNTSQPANYPLTAGNITYYGFYESYDGSNQTFPNYEVSNINLGDLSFIFQRTE